MPAPLARSRRDDREEPLDLAIAESAAVGSSITMIRASRASAFAISTSCCCPTERRETGTSSGSVEAELVQRALRRVRGRAAASRNPPRVGSAPERDVRGRRQLRHERELLIDHADPEPLAPPAARRSCTGVAVDEDLAFVGLQRAGEDLHQRRFAGAVFADEHEHFARDRASAKRRRARVRRESDFPMPRISSSGARGNAVELNARSWRRPAYTCRRRSSRRGGGVLPREVARDHVDRRARRSWPDTGSRRRTSRPLAIASRASGVAS